MFHLVLIWCRYHIVCQYGCCGALPIWENILKERMTMRVLNLEEMKEVSGGSGCTSGQAVKLEGLRQRLRQELGQELG